MSRRDVECKVYVGDLDKNVDEEDIKSAFSRYGKLKNVWVARAPPGFAFVEFENKLDAEDAVREMDGSDLAGSRVRVEMSTGKSRPKPWLGRGGGYNDRYRGGGGRYGDDMKCYECNRTGHIARDCPIRTRGRRGGDRYSRSRSRSPRRSSRYSRSRSRDRY